MISGRDSASSRSFSAMGASRARRSLRTPPCGGLTMLGQGGSELDEERSRFHQVLSITHFPLPRGWRACVSCTCIKPVRAIPQDCAIETAAAAGKTGHILHHNHVMPAWPSRCVRVRVCVHLWTVCERRDAAWASQPASQPTVLSAVDNTDKLCCGWPEPTPQTTEECVADTFERSGPLSH